MTEQVQFPQLVTDAQKNSPAYTATPDQALLFTRMLADLALAVQAVKVDLQRLQRSATSTGTPTQLAQVMLDDSASYLENSSKVEVLDQWARQMFANSVHYKHAAQGEKLAAESYYRYMTEAV